MTSAQLKMDAPKGRRDRLVWSPDLEDRFDEAVRKLGGLEEATPSQIKEEMKTDLTLGHIKSHLQKIRNDARRYSYNDGIGIDLRNDQFSPDMSSSHADQRRRSFDSAFPALTSNNLRGNSYSSIARSKELSSQLDTELSFFSNFKC